MSARNYAMLCAGVALAAAGAVLLVPGAGPAVERLLLLFLSANAAG